MVLSGRFEMEVPENDFIAKFVQDNKLEWEFWWRCDLDHLYIPGTSIVDVGGNMGWNALVFSEYGPVHTYEPLYHSWLATNCSKNILKNTVVVYPYGLSSTNGECKIFIPPTETCNNNGLASMNKSFWNGHETIVPIARLDDVYTGGPFSIMKIDVEQHELEVLTGAEQLINRYKPVIFIEIFNYFENPCVAFLHRMGYSKVLQRPHDNYVFIYRDER